MEIIGDDNMKDSGLILHGRTYVSLDALGSEMLQRLWKGDKNDCEFWDKILCGELSNALKSKKIALSDRISTIKKFHSQSDRAQRDKFMDYYKIAYLICRSKLLKIGNNQVENIAALKSYMKLVLDSSHEEFEDLCYSLIDSV